MACLRLRWSPTNFRMMPRALTGALVSWTRGMRTHLKSYAIYRLSGKRNTRHKGHASYGNTWGCILIMASNVSYLIAMEYN